MKRCETLRWHEAGTYESGQDNDEELKDKKS